MRDMQQANSGCIMQKYRILGKKGEGTFSEVLTCQNIKDGTYWACKKMRQHYDSIEQVNNLREIQAMRRLRPHRNVLELNEVLFDKKAGTLMLICELMDMNIYEMIRGRKCYLAEKKIKHYIYQLLRAVDHMHRLGIFHRDIKPENILIKDDLLKLADYGSCRSVFSKQPYTEYISTRWYRAPECLLTDGYYTYKMDLWSVGCVFFEVMSLHPLFPGSNEMDQLAKIHDVIGTPDAAVLSKLRNKSRGGVNFNFPQKKGCGIERQLPHATSECIEVIYQMCIYDPEERLSAKHVLRHSYFKEFRDVEKRAAAVLKQDETEKLETTAAQSPTLTKRRIPLKENMPNGQNLLVDSTSSDRTSDAKKPLISHSIEPVKGKASLSLGPITNVLSLPKYNALQESNSYQFQRREQRRRKHRRFIESGPNPIATSLLPKMHLQKPSSFQSTFGNGSMLSKYPNPNATYLPSLPHAFGKSDKTRASNNITKNTFGYNQLPSIARREGHF